MVGRLFVRMMMVVLMVVAVWLLFLIWQVYSGAFESKLLLTMMASSLLLSNLTLLIQSVISFNVYYARRESLWSLIGGYLLMPEAQKDNFTAHYCLLSWARSFTLAMFMIIVVLLVATFCLATSGLIYFLSNPYMPHVPIREVGFYLGIVALAFLGALLGIQLFDKLSIRIVSYNRIVKGLLSRIYIVIYGGFFFGTLGYIFFSLGDFSWFTSVSMVFGVILVLIAFVDVVIGISYGIVKLVQKASERYSERYSVLGKIWNTLCPVQEINIYK